MQIMTHPGNQRGAHRAPSPPRLRLTRRGRIVRDLVAGAVLLGVAVFAQSVSVAFFTALMWAGQLTGLAA